MEAMLANINKLLVHSAGKALGATYAQLLRNRHLHNLWSFLRAFAHILCSAVRWNMPPAYAVPASTGNTFGCVGFFTAV